MSELRLEVTAYPTTAEINPSIIVTVHPIHDRL